MNISIFCISLKYINSNYTQITPIATWILDELKTINYNDSKIIKAFYQNDLSTIQFLVSSVNDISLTNQVLEYYITNDKLISRHVLDSLLKLNKSLFDEIVDIDKAFIWSCNNQFVDLLSFLLQKDSDVIRQLSHNTIVSFCEYNRLDIITIMLKVMFEVNRYWLQHDLFIKITMCNFKYIDIFRYIVEYQKILTLDIANNLFNVPEIYQDIYFNIIYDMLIDKFHVLLIFRKINLVKKILERNRDILYKNKNIGYILGYRKAIRALYQYIDITRIDSDALLQIGCHMDKPELVKQAIDKRVHIMDSFLLLAVDNYEILKLLLENGANVNYKSDILLRIHCQRRRISKQILELLLKYGADNKHHWHNICLLDACKFNNSIDIIKMLIDDGAVPNDKCLEYACRTDRNYEVVKLLLNKNINPNVGIEIAIKCGQYKISRLLLLEYNAHVVDKSIAATKRIKNLLLTI